MRHPLGWIVALLALTSAAWMVFDGLHALATGDYVTPSSGPYAGQLGPWAPLVEALGIAPRSGLMKSIFVAYGALWLACLAGYLLRAPWSWTGMLILAAGSLWYLVIGTALSLLQMGLLLAERGLAARRARP